MQPHKKIGDRLIEAGLITEEQLNIALEEQKKSGELIGAILFSLGFIEQENLFPLLTVSHGDSSGEPHGELDVPDDIIDVIRQSSSAVETTDKDLEGITDISQVPLVRLVENIIDLGVKKGATDIHIGPDTKGARVRYRVDGMLQHGMHLPKKILPAIVSRIKIMGSMNIAENRTPQDGATEYNKLGQNFDIRISTFPLSGGENIVMRLLNKSKLLIGLESLGFSKDAVLLLNKTLTLPYGMILVTGPTGSGKTTTLYSALSIINSVNKNIFTIEDPIEYQLPLVRQSQINVKAGLTFASGLRSILRQDPDVILVGEMRDLETAELAIRSSLTGHLVFSTLHTNDAASSIPRLIDMGVEPFLLASTLDTVISQRLIRLLCSECKKPSAPPEDLMNRLGFEFPKDAVVYSPVGCTKCNNSGYSGRTIIFEIMKMDDDMRKMMINKSGSDMLFETAIQRGMKSMLEVGIEKALSGLTSLEEVLSSTRTII